MQTAHYRSRSTPEFRLWAPVVLSLLVTVPHVFVQYTRGQGLHLIQWSSWQVFALQLGIAVVGPEEVDRLNIFGATMLAMSLAMARLCEALGADCAEALIDGNLTPAGRCAEWRWPARAIVGGDGKEAAIGAASILAKEYRDRLMRNAALAHPQYGWERNKGYGTPDHLAALREHGPTLLHRRSFAPVAQAELAF